MTLAGIFKKMLMGRMFSTERGRIRMFGKMDWIMNPAVAYATELQMIGEKLGPNWLFKQGYAGGKSGAEEMIKSMGLKMKGGWATQKAIVALLEFIGFGKPDFVIKKHDEKGHHHFIVRVKDNPVIEHSKRLFGRKSLACHWFMGIYSAHGEMGLGLKNIRLRENKCFCKGAKFCEWESKW